jgi:nicotinamidase-related amidase
MATLELDPRTTALIIIDLQRGVVGRQTAPYPAADVVDRCAKLAADFRSQNAPIVYVRVDIANMFDVPVDSSMRPPGSPPPPPEFSELIPEAGFQPGDLFVTKRSWGAFGSTDLEKLLRDRGILTVVIGGIATNFGVESTARNAKDLGFAVVLPEDAMTSLSAEAHQFAVQQIFPRLARVRKAAEISFSGA